jgi:hypothetical protein
MLGFDRSAMVAWSSFPPRSRQFVGTSVRPTTDTEGLTTAPLRRHRSDRCLSPVRPLPGWTGGRPSNVARAGSRQGGTRRVALGSVRPPRTPSIDVETKKELQVIDWKSIRQREKVKI